MRIIGFSLQRLLIFLEKIDCENTITIKKKDIKEKLHQDNIIEKTYNGEIFNRKEEYIKEIKELINIIENDNFNIPDIFLDFQIDQIKILKKYLIITNEYCFFF